MMNNAIFISYRIDDTGDVTGRIYDYLVRHFGSDRIFKDVFGIKLGVDYRKEINQALDGCQVLLAVIGPTWLTVTDKDGKRRLDSPGDWVRLEIETALARGIPVIPLQVKGASLPSVDELPESIKELAYRNGTEIRLNDPDFGKDMGWLVQNIESTMPAAMPAKSPADVNKLPTLVALTPEQRKALRTALISAFPTAADLSLMVADELGENLNTITQNQASYQVTVQELVKWAEARGKIQKLLEGALTVNPDNPQLKQFADTWNHPTHSQVDAGEFDEDLDYDIALEMVKIPKGIFWMGSPENELEREDNEGPRHRVGVKSFYMSKYPVTQEQWWAVAGHLPKVKRDLNSEPSRFKGDRHPVECVTWLDAVEFCDRLSQKTGKQYRLPSEAEWEYACRAGTETPFYFGETITPQLANYNGNYTYGAGSKGVSRERTTAVGCFPPNAFGLYDMHGNVWEWCADHWHDNYQGAPVDGSAWVTGGNSKLLLLRGGSWSNYPRDCRSASRGWFEPADRYNDIGFRVVCSAAWTP